MRNPASVTLPRCVEYILIMNALLILCAAACAAVVLLTISQTREAYPELPEQVPIHLDAFGNVNGLGPRPVIWTLVFVQIVSALALAFSAWSIASAKGSPMGMAVFAIFITLIVWRAQNLLLEAAKSPDRRANIRPFWWQFSGLLVGGVAVLMLLT